MAGKPMREILGDRACREHPDAPRPCAECAGQAQSTKDRAKGGFKGTVSKFEEAGPTSDRERDEAEGQAQAAVRATISRWGLRKQLHAEGKSAVGI